MANWPRAPFETKGFGVGSKKSTQQGNSHFCAQSVPAVREHGKMVRTPLMAFFNRPTYSKVLKTKGRQGHNYEHRNHDKNHHPRLQSRGYQQSQLGTQRTSNCRNGNACPDGSSGKISFFPAPKRGQNSRLYSYDDSNRGLN